MSDIESNSPKPADSGALLNSLLSNPDLIRNISSMLSVSGAGTAEQATPPPPSFDAPPSGNSEAMAEGISRVLSNPEMMAKLPEVMKMLAPMMQPTAQSSSATVPASATPKLGGEGKDRRDCRNDLLVALKPFLSPARCQAVDMLLGLSRLGYALEKLI